MSTITAILKPNADGTLHLPIPPEWRDQAIKVKAEIEPVSATSDVAKVGIRKDLEGFGCLLGKIGMSPDFDEPLEDFKDYMG